MRLIVETIRQPNARYPTSAPEMCTDADRLRVSRAAGGRSGAEASYNRRTRGPQHSRHWAAARALAIADLPPMIVARGDSGTRLLVGSRFAGDKCVCWWEVV